MKNSPITLNIDISNFEAQIQNIVNSNKKISENYIQLLEQFKTFESRMDYQVLERLDSIIDAKHNSDKEILCNEKTLKTLENKKIKLQTEILEIHDELKSLKEIKKDVCK